MTSSAVRPKPWSVADFERERAHMTEWVRSTVIPHLEHPDVRRVLIRAPVKSGKREMVEYIAMRDNVTPKVRVHAFTSAFHRVADEPQRAELLEHNITVFSITSDDTVEEFKRWHALQKAAGCQIVVHLDECDYGSGHRQKMRSVWSIIREDPATTVIMYSATPEEVLFSEEAIEEAAPESGIVNTIFREGIVLEYTPPAGYCGPKRFLSEGLINKAEPFFKYRSDGSGCLSSQGSQIMHEMRVAHSSDPRRNMLVLRLSYGEIGGAARGKQKKAFYQFLQNLTALPELMADDVNIHLDKGSFPECEVPSTLRSRINCGVIDWSNPRFWRLLNTEDLHIIVIDQTSTRSTEWACHDRLYAYHDYRNTVSFGTVSQAQERVNHYEGRYGGFQPIKVYGHRRSFELSAGVITYEQYLTYDWEKRKIDIRTAGSPIPLYRIRSNTTGAIHPEYPDPLTEADANAALERLDCLALISLSARVRGSTYYAPVYKADFCPVSGITDADFAAFVAGNLHSRPAWSALSFANPFTESQAKGLSADGRYKGYLRGWSVLDYDVDIVPQPGWGIGAGSRPRLTICYRSGALGIAVRYFTGEYHKENTLSAFNTMYYTGSGTSP